MRRCPKCALDNDVESKFCIGCGTALVKPPRAPLPVSLGEEATLGDDSASPSIRADAFKSKDKEQERVAANPAVVQPSQSGGSAAPPSVGDAATIGFKDGMPPPLPPSAKKKPASDAVVDRSPSDARVASEDKEFVNRGAASYDDAEDAENGSTESPFRAARKSLSGAWSQREKLAGGAATGIGAVLSSAIQAMKFYWFNRQLLWRTFVVYVPALEDSNVRMRELHLSSDHDFDGVKLRESGWSVRLPECCVVCGESTENDWTRETREVDQMTWPLWSGIGGFAVGLITLFWWSYWWIPLFGFLGLWLGYWGRSQIRVKLKYQRCDRHIEKVEFPGVRVAPKLLIVEVGKRAVKTKFLDSQRNLLPGLRPDEFV